MVEKSTFTINKIILYRISNVVDIQDTNIFNEKIKNKDLIKKNIFKFVH